MGSSSLHTMELHLLSDSFSSSILQYLLLQFSSSASPLDGHMTWKAPMRPSSCNSPGSENGDIPHKAKGSVGWVVLPLPADQGRSVVWVLR